jgi:hypothetical protein
MNSTLYSLGNSYSGRRGETQLIYDILYTVFFFIVMTFIGLFLYAECKEKL